MEIKSILAQCPVLSEPIISYNQCPPSTKSISFVRVFHGAGAHHLSNNSDCVHADQTWFSGASKERCTLICLASLSALKFKSAVFFISSLILTLSIPRLIDRSVSIGEL